MHHVLREHQSSPFQRRSSKEQGQRAGKSTIRRCCPHLNQREHQKQQMSTKLTSHPIGVRVWSDGQTKESKQGILSSAVAITTLLLYCGWMQFLFLLVVFTLLGSRIAVTLLIAIFSTLLLPKKPLLWCDGRIRGRQPTGTCHLSNLACNPAPQEGVQRELGLPYVARVFQVGTRGDWKGSCSVKGRRALLIFLLFTQVLVPLRRELGPRQDLRVRRVSTRREFARGVSTQNLKNAPLTRSSRWGRSSPELFVT